MLLLPLVGLRLHELEANSDGYLWFFLGTDEVAVGEQALAHVRWLQPAPPLSEAQQLCLSACEQRYEQEQSVCADAGTDPGLCHELSSQEYCAGSCDIGDDDASAPGQALSPQVIRAQGDVRLAAWGDPLVFARTEQGEFEVPASKLPLLLGDVSQCLDRVGNWHTVPGGFPGGNTP